MRPKDRVKSPCCWVGTGKRGRLSMHGAKWLAGVPRQEGADYFLNAFRPPLPRRSLAVCLERLSHSRMSQENCHHLYPLLGESEDIVSESTL